MIKFKLPKTRAFANLLHNTFYKNTIIIFVGSKGISFSAINDKKVIDSIFVAFGEREELEKYRNFLQKFKKYYLFFLLDHNECALHHELVPVLQSIVKTNPVEEFIKEHFAEEDIVAYNIYSITTQTSENWAVVLASLHYQPPLSKLFSFFLEDISIASRFGGVYFLALEFKTIIDKIIEITGNIDCHNDLQIFVSILNTSSMIKCVVKHQENIISIKSIDYPSDKSLLYVQGVIEQEVNDCLISYKKYVKDNNLRICIIFLTNKELQQLLQPSTFEAQRVICLSHQDIIKTEINDSIFVDTTVVRLFAKQKSFLGLSSKIRSIIKFGLLNRWIFKPFIIVIVMLLLMLLELKVNTILNKKQATLLNNEYYKVAWEYRIIKQKYPEIKDVTNLADLYNFEQLLKIPVLAPFDLLDKLLDNLSDPRIHLSGIKWQLNDYDNTTLSKQSMKLEVSIKFISKDSSIEESLATFNEYMANLRNSFVDFDVSDVRHNDKITNLFNEVIIPISITILGPNGSR